VSLLDGLLAAFWRSPTSRLADARVGHTIVVVGQVVPRDLLDSPLFGERCVYYRYTVESWRPASGALGGDGFWQETEHDESISEFYLEDGGARAIVSPHRARVKIGRGHKPRVLDLGDRLRRARELVLVPGDRVEVRAEVGRVVDLYDDARDYRSDANQLALLAPTIRILTSDERRPAT
jgi:hypothetical protein